jgi:hypothetical protein
MIDQSNTRDDCGVFDDYSTRENDRASLSPLRRTHLPARPIALGQGCHLFLHARILCLELLGIHSQGVKLQHLCHGIPRISQGVFAVGVTVAQSSIIVVTSQCFCASSLHAHRE